MSKGGIQKNNIICNIIVYVEIRRIYIVLYYHNRWYCTNFKRFCT